MPWSRKFVYFIVIIVLFVWLYWLFSDRDKAMKTLFVEVCSETDKLKKNCQAWDPNLPIVYAITPTFARSVQKAELTRLSQTLRLVPNFHWILVEDANEPSALVANLLKTSRLNFTHLVMPTPEEWKLKPEEPRWKKPRGVWQRNAGITWLRENRNKDTDRGVVYFADDDNTYNVQLFEEMRHIRKVGVWPVGLLGGLRLETAFINPATGKVKSWNTIVRPKRKFPVDMAGFAVNLQHLHRHPEAKFLFRKASGLVETTFLQQLVSNDDLEPRADNCTKVYVWHTRTEEPEFKRGSNVNQVEHIEV